MEVIRWISDYKSFIKEFESVLFSKFEIKKPDYIYNYIGALFDKNGKIADYEYHFHGAGCRVLKKKMLYANMIS